MHVKVLTLSLAHTRYSMSGNYYYISCEKYQMNRIKGENKNSLSFVWLMPSFTLTLLTSSWLLNTDPCDCLPHPQRADMTRADLAIKKHKPITHRSVCPSTTTLSRLPLSSSLPGPFSVFYISLTIQLWPGSTGQHMRHAIAMWQIVHWLSCQAV